MAQLAMLGRSFKNICQRNKTWQSLAAVNKLSITLFILTFLEIYSVACRLHGLKVGRVSNQENVHGKGRDIFWKGISHSD